MVEAAAHEIGSRTLRRQVVSLAIPVLIEQTLLYFVGLSDTLITGRYLAEDHLAAVTVAGYLLWFLSSLLTVVSVGATALVARMFGANERPVAVRITQQALLMAMILGTLIAVGGIALAPGIVWALNLRGEPAQLAVVFLRIVLSVTPLLACTTAGVACLRGAGDTRTGGWVMVLVNILNVTFTWTLVRGWGPIPAYGFPGVAAGTAVAEGIGGIIVLVVLARGRSGLVFNVRDPRPSWPEIRRILRISLPATGESLTNVLCQLWFLGLINRLGPVATAAHGVAIRCEAIAFLTVTAFAVPAGTLTGQYLGARRPDLAGRAARISWAMGCLILAALGVLLFTQAGPMFRIFLGGGKPAVSEAGVPVLRIVAFGMPALATINVLSGALRGAGDTRWPWLFAAIGYLGIRLPLTYVLARPETSGAWAFGLQGAWLAMLVDLYVRGALYAARFQGGRWREATV